MGRTPEGQPVDPPPAGAAGGPPSPGRADGWVLATLPRALAFAAGLLADRDAAEDVVHDCYCRLLQRADAYDLPRDGAKLLFRSITNACIDRSRRRSPVSLSGADPDDGGAAGGNFDLGDPRAVEPWRLVDHDDLRRAVADGLDKLPTAQRAALELKSLGHSQQEIADALGVTPTNAGVLVYRARQALAKHLGPRAEA